MHLSAKNFAERFLSKYCLQPNKDKIVLDVGSTDPYLTLRNIFKEYTYVGLDLVDGPNVDIVYEHGKFPYPDNHVDIIVSSSCFEHDEFFWVTFLEMCRVLKTDGYIYINVPSSGMYHAAPIDCWRFYKDSWKSLANWAVKNNYKINLIENFVDKKDPMWKDSVGIFKKS